MGGGERERETELRAVPRDYYLLMVHSYLYGIVSALILHYILFYSILIYCSCSLCMYIYEIYSRILITESKYALKFGVYICNSSKALSVSRDSNTIDRYDG